MVSRAASVKRFVGRFRQNRPKVHDLAVASYSNGQQCPTRAGATADAVHREFLLRLHRTVAEQGGNARRSTGLGRQPWFHGALRQRQTLRRPVARAAGKVRHVRSSSRHPARKRRSTTAAADGARSANWQLPAYTLVRADTGLQPQSCSPARLPVQHRTWAELHEKAFRRLGGACRTVVLDNLSEGVLKPDIYDPALNPLYRDMLAHYGAVALPCRVADPDRKGLNSYCTS